MFKFKVVFRLIKEKYMNKIQMKNQMIGLMKTIIKISKQLQIDLNLINN